MGRPPCSARLERSEQRKPAHRRAADARRARASRRLPRRPGRPDIGALGLQQDAPLGLLHARRPPIRLSDRLQGMPSWVVDYVLVHELAHLLEPGHDARFWALGRPLPEGRAGAGLPRRASRPRPSSTRRRAPRTTSPTTSTERRQRAGARQRRPARPCPARRVGQGVDRPPAHVERLVADHGLGAVAGATARNRTSRWCTVPRGSQNVTACSSRCTGTGSRTRSGSPDSSVRLAQRRAGQGGVAGLAVAAELEPLPRLAVQVEQHPVAVGGRAPGRRRSGGRGSTPASSRRRARRGARRSVAQRRVLAGGGVHPARATARASACRRRRVERRRLRSVGRRRRRRPTRRRAARASAASKSSSASPPGPRRGPRGSPAGRRGRRRWAAGRGAPRPRRGPRCPGGSAASPTGRRRRAAGAGAAPGRPARRRSPRPDRRRRGGGGSASCILAAAGIRSAVAWPTTSSTQPSTSASVVSSRVSAASWAGVLRGSNSPPSIASWIAVGVGRVDAARSAPRCRRCRW